jgi:hypothetical protein
MAGERHPWRSAGVVALIVGAALVASVGCAAKVQENEMRAVWVPRELSHGLVIDEASSDVHRIYRPRAEEEGSRRPRSGVGAAAPPSQK